MVGVSSLCMLHDSLETFLERVGKTFSHVEVICEVHADFEILKSYGYTVSFHAPFSDLNIASVNRAMVQESLRQIFETVEMANAHDVEAVCVHPGHFSPLGARFAEKSLRVHRDSLRALTRKAEECGVFVGIENMPRFPILLGKTVEEMREILDVGGNLGVTLDVGHANTAGDPLKFLSLKEFVRVVHLHDNMGREDAHLPLGRGTLNLDMVKELAGKRAVVEVYTWEDAVTSLECLKSLGITEHH